MEETFSDFSAFVTRYNNDNYEAVMSSTSKGYGKALKALRERENFELQLKQSNGSYDVYFAYIEFELSSAKVQIPRLAQTLFERILCVFWQQQPLWLEYTSYAVRITSLWNSSLTNPDTEEIRRRGGCFNIESSHTQLPLERRAMGFLYTISGAA
jgi:hypothetical protein